MTATEYRDAIKRRLGISSTDFNDDIDDFVTQSVKRLPPKAMLETDAEEVAITVSSTGEASVDLTSLTEPVDDVRKIEAYDGTFWFEVSSSDFYRHATTVTVRGLTTDLTKLKVYGLDEYTTTEVPTRLENAVIWFSMAEFYDMLAGNKSKFNQYSQSNGARSMDVMRDQAVYFESKAEVYLDEHSTAYGS